MKGPATQHTAEESEKLCDGMDHIPWISTLRLTKITTAPHTTVQDDRVAPLPADSPSLAGAALGSVPHHHYCCSAGHQDPVWHPSALRTQRPPRRQTGDLDPVVAASGNAHP